MFYSFDTLNDMSAFYGGKMADAKKKGCIILVTMRGCPYCESMKPEWKSFVRENRSNPLFNIIEVERSMITPIVSRDPDIIPISTLTGFPTITFKAPGKNEQIEYKDARTKPKLLKFAKESAKSSLPADLKKKKTKRDNEGVYSRGDKKGKLKKGYKYVDGKATKVD